MAKKAKTWSHLRNSAVYPKEVETHSDAVQALKAEYEPLALEGALAKWNEWEALKDDLENHLSDVNAHITALSSLAF